MVSVRVVERMSPDMTRNRLLIPSPRDKLRLQKRIWIKIREDLRHDLRRQVFYRINACLRDKKSWAWSFFMVWFFINLLFFFYYIGATLSKAT